jgi:hypothetical protein
LSGAVAGFELRFDSLKYGRLIIALTALFANSGWNFISESNQFVTPKARLLDAPLLDKAAAKRAVVVFIFGLGHLIDTLPNPIDIQGLILARDAGKKNL